MRCAEGFRCKHRIAPRNEADQMQIAVIVSPLGDLEGAGFALAGANRSLQVMDEKMDDGIVTAEEILGLQLWGTDMAVLSACDTGLG